MTRLPSEPSRLLSDRRYGRLIGRPLATTWATMLAGVLIGVSACSDTALTAPPRRVDPEGDVSRDSEGARGRDGGTSDAATVVTPVDGLDGGPDGVVDASTEPPPVSAEVEVFVQPDSGPPAFLTAIRGAQRSVAMQMYLLTSDAVVEALIAQKNAGRDVKVILNASFPQGGNANQSAFDRLRGAGVNVVWAPSAFRFTHSKSVIVDGREVWIMTMNATASSPSRNREYLAVTRAKDEVEQAQRIFDADFANRIANADGTLVVAPTNAEQRLLALINSATRSVDVEAEALSDTGIVNALVRAADRGRTVRVVLSTDFSSPGEDQAIATLKRRGIPVVSLTEPYVHAKAIVADGERAYVGSINLTTNSMRNNRELGIITSQPAAVRKIVSTIASDFTAGTRL